MPRKNLTSAAGCEIENSRMNNLTRFLSLGDWGGGAYQHHWLITQAGQCHKGGKGGAGFVACPMKLGLCYKAINTGHGKRKNILYSLRSLSTRVSSPAWLTRCLHQAWVGIIDQPFHQTCDKLFICYMVSRAFFQQWFSYHHVLPPWSCKILSGIRCISIWAQGVDSLMS